MRRLLIAAVSLAVLSGCNTMIHKTYQYIRVNTPGVENADCLLETTANKYRVLSPRSAFVERSRLPMMITCEKVNYTTGTAHIKAVTRAGDAQWNVLNGMVPGVAYDIASNSIYAYPSEVTVIMTPVPNPIVPEKQESYALPKKEEPVKITPPPKAKAEKTMSKSLRK